MCEFCRESWSEETAVIGFTCEFISEESMISAARQRCTSSRNDMSGSLL
jgi:hypothetical protein